MGKNKLAKFEEMESFKNVFQPTTEEARSGKYYMKGNWKSNYFGNANDLIVELGCGKGEYSVSMAKTFKDRNFIGVDIKGARIWRGAKTAMEEKLNNVAFLRTRIEMIASFFIEDEVDQIWLTFPDPQEKKKRKKKRLTASGFLNTYRVFLKDNGIVNLKTDNDLFYNYTLSVIEINELELIYSTSDVHKTDANDQLLQIKTHYEQLFLNENKNINYLKFKLPKNKEIIEPPEEEK